MRLNCSLVPRSSPSPVFDHLQYAKMDRSIFAYCKQSKPGTGEGLGTRLVKPITISPHHRSSYDLVSFPVYWT